jgi:DNA-binding SARP family transcriptional activator/ABC-type transport system substrate-binding protein/outer membrane protein assembly factor BamB
VEFRVLGPLQASQDGRIISLGGARQRGVLAILLLHANRVVSMDAIADGLWGERPPASAANTVQGYISRLRRLLASGDGELIVYSPPGYVLQVEPDRVDAHRFEHLVREATQARASGKLEPAAELLREALGLWQGEALVDLELNSFVQLERRRLEELRLTALEERIELDLTLRRHADLVSELEFLVGEHPLREGFRAQLMLALYRSGRQAEALQVYQQARHALVEELGIEPSQRLRELEQAILRQDASLDLPKETTRPESSDESRQGPSLPMPSTPLRAKGRLRRPVLLVGLACAIGGAVALGLLLPPLFREDTAAAAFRPGTVLLDMKTHKQIAFLPPSQLTSPRFPMFSGGHVWLFNATPRSFVELDPATGKVLTQFEPPDGMTDLPTSTPYAVDGQTLWVGAGDDLVKFDTTLKEEVDRFHLDKIVGQEGTAEGVAVGGGLVWVGRNVGRGQVVAVDPRTGKLRHRFRNVVHHANLTHGGRLVWGGDAAGVNVIDPSTNVVRNVPDLETTDLYFGPASPRVVGASGGVGWTTDSVKGIVYKIDPQGRIVAQYHTGRGVTGAFSNHGVLWVRNEDDGTVTGIDAITGKRTVYRFGHPVGAEVVGGGVLVAALQPATRDVIGVLKGKVARLFSQRGAFGEKTEPALEWNLAADQIEFATCANLLNYPDEPGPAGVQLQPEVATTMPALARDKRTYLFQIRTGYRFSPPSNQPLTAETFRESIERALSPKLERLAQSVRGSGYPLPGPFAVGDIKGEQAFRAGRAKHVSGLRANGERLSITLTRPSPGFLYRLAQPSFCPVPIGTPPIPGAANRSLRGPDEFSIPSAGPYYVADWRKDHYVILKRNPNYHGPRPQRLDAIALREDVDTTVAVDRVRDGRWDGIISSGDVGAAHLDPLLDPHGAVASRYRDGPPEGEQYVPARLFQTGYLALNASRRPFADRTVRRAAAYAINRAKLAAVWQQVPTDQLLPPASPAFRDRRLYRLGRPNLEKAAALMRGRRLVAVMAIREACPACLQEGQLVRAELGRIGIRVRLKVGGDFGPTDRKEAAKFDILDSGLYGYPDNAAFLETVFSEGMPASWLPPGVSHAVERVSRLSGNERQSAAAVLADRLVLNAVPLIPDGSHVLGEFFGSTLRCRIFPPSGVDLAALCRN